MATIYSVDTGPELSVPDFDLDEALDYLSRDFEGKPRLVERHRLVTADRSDRKR